MKTIWAWALTLILFSLPCASALAATLGPASTYEELCALAMQASSGDVLLVSGEFSAAAGDVLSPSVSVRITSASGETATIRGLRLRDAAVTFTHVTLADTLCIEGTSYVEIAEGVQVSGASGVSGLSFTGSGALIIDPDSLIVGGTGAAGIAISHDGGEFYGSIEGVVRGGSGTTGGTGLVISPLSGTGTVLISGEISGGDGTSMGGHALNLYNLSDNAYVTVAGSLQGGSGSIGGDGIQLVSATDNVSVGISGSVKGGLGKQYGGDALILMNVDGASSFNLSGSFSGGDTLEENAQPGTSILLVGDSAAQHAYVNNCILEDGHAGQAGTPETDVQSTPQPTVTPLPEITSSVENVILLTTPQPADAPEMPEASEAPEASQTPETPEAPDMPEDSSSAQEESATPSEAAHASDAA